MQATIFNPFQNITCLSLENTTWENLYYYAITSGLCGFQIELLKEQYDQAQLKIKNSDNIYIDTIYTIEDCIFLGTNKYGQENMAPYIEFNLEFLHKLKCPSAVEKQIAFSINDQKNLNLNESVFECLESESKKINPTIPLKHLNDFIILELPQMQLTAQDIIHEFNMKLDFCDEEENLNLANLELQSIYYKNRTAVAFDFILKNNIAVYKAWSNEFIDSILNLSPINYSKLTKTETLNIILEKINSQGIDELTLTQKEFLYAF